jgi:hypothetical protein
MSRASVLGAGPERQFVEGVDCDREHAMNDGHVRRLVPVVLVSLLTLVAAGCPQLNTWDGPSQDPFFSVEDPLPTEHQVAKPFRLDGKLDVPPQSEPDLDD